MWLKGFLIMEHRLMEIHQKRIVELEVNLHLKKVAVKATEDKIKWMEAQTKTDKVKAVIEAKLMAIEEHKTLLEFEAKVIKDSFQ